MSSEYILSRELGYCLPKCTSTCAVRFDWCTPTISLHNDDCRYIVYFSCTMRNSTELIRSILLAYSPWSLTTHCNTLLPLYHFQTAFKFMIPIHTRHTSANFIFGHLNTSYLVNLDIIYLNIPQHTECVLTVSNT